MCMGIPEGRVRSNGWLPYGESGPDYFKIKISGPDRGPDCNILFSTFKIFYLGLTKS